MNEKQKDRVANASPMYRGVIQKAYKGHASPRSAIRAFCLQCVGYIRKDVTDCTALGCPLWLYRPYQAGENDVEDDVQT